MRSIDLYSHIRIKGVDLATICDLMLEIERGEEGQPDFYLAEPDLGPTFVFVSGVGPSGSGAHAWILNQDRRTDIFYLAMSTSRRYSDCIYLGAPERVRAGCLLSLDEAVPFLEQIIDGKKFARPWHWVSRRKAFEDT